MSTIAQSERETAPEKGKYRIKHWPEYDRALVQRGDMTVWFEEDYLREHWQGQRSGNRGAPLLYSDEAIQVLLTLKAIFHLPYRAVEGLARSLMRLMNLDYRIPDHTHLSRRARHVSIAIPRRERHEPLHVVVDSTGLKIYGEGEWKVRKHGVSKRRRWIKVHLATDAKVKDTVGVEVTTEDWADCEVFSGLIDQIEGDLTQIDGDGAYDTHDVYEVTKQRSATLVVPPRDNAAAWKEGHPRNDVQAQI